MVSVSKKIKPLPIFRQRLFEMNDGLLDVKDIAILEGIVIEQIAGIFFGIDVSHDEIIIAILFFYDLPSIIYRAIEMAYICICYIIPIGFCISGEEHVGIIDLLIIFIEIGITDDSIEGIFIEIGFGIPIFGEIHEILKHQLWVIFIGMKRIADIEKFIE